MHGFWHRGKRIEVQVARWGLAALAVAALGSSSCAAHSAPRGAPRAADALAVETGATQDGTAHDGGAREQGPPAGTPVAASAPRRKAASDAPAGDANLSSALLLAAGPMPPPGLSSARDGERQRERQLALEALRSHGNALGAERLRAELRARLHAPAAERDWEAAAYVVGALRLAPLARDVAAGLDSDGRRAAVARRALHGMFGVWFEDRADFAPFEAIEDPTAIEPYATWLARQALVQEQRLADLWRLDPRSIEPYLGHVSPALRRKAAAALSNAVGESTLDSAFAAPLLFARAQSEHDGRAFCDQVDALTDVLQGSSAESEFVLAARAWLNSVGRDGPPEWMHCVARALAALPAGKPIARDASANGSADPVSPPALVDLDLLLARDAGLDHGDVDVRIGLIEAVRGLVARSAYRPSQADPAGRRVVARMIAIAGSPEQPTSARSAAAAALADLASAGDIAELLALLEGARSDAGLRFALLGALARVGVGLGAEDDRSRELARVAVKLLAEADVDVRRRALSLLSDPGVEANVAPVELVRAFAAESSAEMRGQLLALLQRSGRPEDIDTLLGESRLDEHAAISAARAAEVAETLLRLSGDDSERLLRGARCLVRAARLAAATAAAAAPAPQGVGVPVDAARLTRALELVARVAPDAAAALQGADHVWIVERVHELYAGGAVLRGSLPGAEEFLVRLVDVHLPAALAAEATPAAAARGARVLALARVELRAPRASVIETFGEAERLANAAGESALGRAVVRDRARYLAAAGSGAGALVDFRALLRGDAEAASGGAPMLHPSDLRTAAALARAEPPGTAEAALDAYGFARALVQHRAWRSEAPGLRQQDLVQLAECALASGDTAAMAQVHKELAELPTSPESAANGADRDPTQPLWAGLVGREEWRAALLDLDRRLAARLGAPPSNGGG
ncbi:MAG: hypothetical protein GC161_15740 [Planctomycetaceae bacterium]|nr:hypothetical protein [Planctomycetaceae bacterium]